MNKFEIKSDYRSITSIPYTSRPLNSNHAYSMTDFEVTIKSASFAVDARNEYIYCHSMPSVLDVVSDDWSVDDDHYQDHVIVYKKTALNPTLSINLSSMILDRSVVKGDMARQVVDQSIQLACRMDKVYEEKYLWFLESAVHVFARLHRAFGEQSHFGTPDKIYVHLYGYLLEEDITYMHLRF